ncbi:MAG: signal peptidase II [Syntrophobacterales bacterium]|nr:MAG: signal peptidase II [Syntrophobacterales bacterium]
MRKKYLILVVVFCAVFFFDQITKAYVHRTLHEFQSVEIVKDFFHITHIRNTGAAFGLLAGPTHPLRTILFVIVSGLAIGVILIIYWKIWEDDTLHALALSLLLGGAAGNLMDRVWMGQVIDFLDFHWYDYHWPAFNFADAAICGGIGLILLNMVMGTRRNPLGVRARDRE